MVAVGRLSEAEGQTLLVRAACNLSSSSRILAALNARALEFDDVDGFGRD
jgi:hypothetical protein